MSQQTQNDSFQIKEIAKIIKPSAFDGTSPNGRLDEADALDTAEEVFDYMVEDLDHLIKDRLYNAFEDYSVIKAEFVSDLEEYLRKGDLGGIRKVIDNLQEPHDVISELDFTFDR